MNSWLLETGPDGMAVTALILLAISAFVDHTTYAVVAVGLAVIAVHMELIYQHRVADIEADDEQEGSA